MKLTSRENTKPILSEHGEIIHELIGRDGEQATDLHSVAHVILPPGKSSLSHFHPVAEESYYFLRGKGKIIIEDEEAVVLPGQAVLIPPTKRHKIISVGETDLEFIAVCVPAWEPTNTQYLESFDR
jgi:mannose-6-phosphate isomerase-like protein (cupin superfamily)